MEIISYSDREWFEDYRLSFTYPEGWGFSFESSADGEIFFEDNRPFDGNPAWYNMNTAVTDFLDGKCSMEIVDYSRSMRVPMKIRCTETVKIEVMEFRNGIEPGRVIDTRFEPCNEEIELWGDECCDNCGQWYNSSGQRLTNDWFRNPSYYDDEIGDMEGYEMMHAGDY